MEGRKDLSRNNLGFVDGQLVYFRIAFKAQGIQHLEHSMAMKVYEYWQN